MPTGIIALRPLERLRRPPVRDHPGRRGDDADDRSPDSPHDRHGAQLHDHIPHEHDWLWPSH